MIQTTPSSRPEQTAAATTLDQATPATQAEFRAQAHRMLDDMLDYAENIRQRPVWQPIPDQVRAEFVAPLPLEAADLANVHQQFMNSILPFTAANTHPGFLGWAQGGGSQVGMLAEMLTAALNANVGGRDQAPLEVERQVTAWMRDLFHFPEQASGIFLTGTSMANFVAVVIARTARLGAQVRRTGLDAQLTAYASTAVHGSIAKALDLAGLGSEQLRLVTTDASGRIDLTALAHSIDQDREAGLTPFLVIGSAGTVDIGAIDDLEALADLCAEHNLWFHVDGALGALGMLAPALRAALKGIERADTLAFDFHKWAQVPYDAGFLLVRDGKLHQQAFASPCSYLSREPRGLSAGAVWPCDLGPELSRNFRALKVWMTFKVYGAHAIGAAIQNTCDLARSLARLVKSNPELELLAPVALNIVCFRYRTSHAEDPNQLNRELVVRLHESGIVAPSTTLLEGRVAIRAAIVNHRTTQSEIDALLENTLAIGRQLDAEASSTPGTQTPAELQRVRQAHLSRLNHALTTAALEPSLEVRLLVDRAMLLAQLGRPLEARSDHLRVLELEPGHRVNLLELGRLLVSTGQQKAARVVYLEAITHYPDDEVSQVNLAGTLLETGDPEAARQHYEIALRLNPTLPEAHGGLYYALTRLGQPAAAALHRQRAFGQKNLFRKPFRGAAEPIPVILLVSSTGGNTPIEKLLDDTVFEVYVVVADFYDPHTALPDHQLIVNGIGDVEVAQEALEAARLLLADTTTPVLNRPSAVLATGRMQNAERLSALPGIRTARTHAYPFAALAEANALSTLARDGFTFPLLLRLPGFHMGEHFIQVDQPASFPDAIASLPRFGRTDTEILAIEYLDARGHDGCFRKYRVMFIDGELYPLHLAISKSWKIHYFSADMADRPDHRAEEANFLADMATALGTRAVSTLRSIQQALDLDYAGIDFGLNPQGEVLLFETNATMVVEQPNPDPRWDYRRQAVERIHDAVRRMLLQHLHQRSGVQPAALSGRRLLTHDLHRAQQA